jgi:hypothetical protein
MVPMTLPGLAAPVHPADELEGFTARRVLETVAAAVPVPHGS